MVKEIITKLLDLKDEAAVHIWPDDLKKCRRSECMVRVYSVRMGSPTTKTVPLFSIEQIRYALIEAGVDQQRTPLTVEQIDKLIPPGGFFTTETRKHYDDTYEVAFQNDRNVEEFVRLIEQHHGVYTPK